MLRMTGEYAREIKFCLDNSPFDMRMHCDSGQNAFCTHTTPAVRATNTLLAHTWSRNIDSLIIIGMVRYGLIYSFTVSSRIYITELW